MPCTYTVDHFQLPSFEQYASCANFHFLVDKVIAHWRSWKIVLKASSWPIVIFAIANILMQSNVAIWLLWMRGGKSIRCEPGSGVRHPLADQQQMHVERFPPGIINKLILLHSGKVHTMSKVATSIAILSQCEPDKRDRVETTSCKPIMSILPKWPPLQVISGRNHFHSNTWHPAYWVTILLCKFHFQC